MKEIRQTTHHAFSTKCQGFFKEGRLPVDVALIQVSRPDAKGMCSFGLSSDYTKPAAECAKIVIAEVNEQMPRVGGDNFIHVSDLDYIVETNNPLYEIPLPRIGDVEKPSAKTAPNLLRMDQPCNLA